MYLYTNINNKFSTSWNQGAPSAPKLPLSSMNWSLRTGIFDVHEQSPLHAWNLVYVPYCTSDAFMGSLVAFYWISFCICENPVLHDIWFKKIQKQLVSVALLEHVQGSCHPCSLGRFRRCRDRRRYLWILAVPWCSCGACCFEEAQRTTPIRKEASSDLSENHQSFWMPPKLMWNCTTISYQSLSTLSP